MPGGGMLDNILAQGSSDETSVLAALFPSKTHEERLIMLSELPPELVFPMSVLRTVQKRFKSKILGSMANSLYLNEIPKDRKGRLEGVETFLGMRRMLEGAEE